MACAAQCREASSALAALRRSDKKVQATLEGLSEQAARHGATAASARLALEQAVVNHSEAQRWSSVARREQEALDALGAAGQLLEQKQPEPLERAVQALEGVALRLYCIEGEDGSDLAAPSLVALLGAAARGQLRLQEAGSAGSELRKRCTEAVVAWEAALERWLSGEPAALLFAGARALALQPPGGLACGVDGLEGERAALHALRRLRSAACRLDALAPILAVAPEEVLQSPRAAAAAATPPATPPAPAGALAARWRLRLHAGASARLGGMVQVAVQLAAHSAAAPEPPAARAALAEAAASAAQAARCAASVFALLEEGPLPHGGGGGGEPAEAGEEGDEAALAAARRLVDHCGALLAALEECGGGGGGGGGGGLNALRAVAGSAGGFYRELLAAQALLVSCGQSAAGRRQLSRLAEASERLEAAARAGDATQEPAATEGPAE